MLHSVIECKNLSNQRLPAPIDLQRQAKLEKIGFEWSIQAPKASWEERFAELKAYKEEHGDCR